MRNVTIEPRRTVGYNGTRAPVWQDRAACQGMDPAIFFDSARWADGLRVCATCPVRVECLKDDLNTTDRASICGVRGGLTEGERRDLWRRRRAGLPEQARWAV